MGTAGGSSRPRPPKREPKKSYRRQEAYTEAVRLIPEIRTLAPDNPILTSLQGKIDFYDQRFVQAEEAFDSLIASGDADSGVLYLKGLLLSRREDWRGGVAFLQQALAEEPEYFLYVYKMAEFCFHLGDDPAPYLEKAAQLNPQDPWVYNLYGMQALKEEDTAGALKWFEAAHDVLPENTDIKINLSEALVRSQRVDQALSVLAGEDPALLRQRGRLLCHSERWEEGIAVLQKGLREIPDDFSMNLDLASALIRTDQYSPAEEILVRLAETRPEAAVLNLLGNLAMVKGEYPRAETAYREALRLEPDNREYPLNLAELYCQLGRWHHAADILAQSQTLADSPRGRRLAQRIDNALYRNIRCAECGRSWRVPRNLSPQPPLRLHGEPAHDLPAGSCEQCGLTYCVGCAQKYLRNSRFHCGSCGSRLTLADDALKYLFKRDSIDKRP